MDVSGQLQAPVALHPGKGPLTRCRGGWLNPRASLDVLEKRKISGSCRDSNPGIFQLVQSHLLRYPGSCCVCITFWSMKQAEGAEYWHPFLVRNAFRVSITAGTNKT
jgi:hypothetical protein